MSATDGKTDRLASALRANLARRKAQARARRAGEDSDSAVAHAPLARAPHPDGEPATGADVRDAAGAEFKERIVPEGEAG